MDARRNSTASSGDFDLQGTSMGAAKAQGKQQMSFAISGHRSWLRRLSGFLQASKQSTFRVVFLLMKVDKINLTPLLYLSLLVEHLQFLVFFLSPQLVPAAMQADPSYKPLRDLTLAFNVTTFLNSAADVWTMYWFVAIWMMTMVVLLVYLVIAVHRDAYIFVWVLKILRVSVGLTSSVLYLPFLRTMVMSIFMAPATAGSSVLAIFCVCVLFAVASVSKLMYFETSYNSAVATARSHGRVDFAWILVRTLLVLLYPIVSALALPAQTMSIVLGVALILVSVLMVALRLFFLPFYMRATNELVVSLAAALVWCSVVSLVAVFVPTMGFGTISMMLLIGSLATVALAWGGTRVFFKTYFLDALRTPVPQIEWGPNGDLVVYVQHSHKQKAKLRERDYAAAISNTDDGIKRTPAVRTGFDALDISRDMSATHNTGGSGAAAGDDGSANLHDSSAGAGSGNESGTAQQRVVSNLVNRNFARLHIEAGPRSSDMVYINGSPLRLLSPMHAEVFARVLMHDRSRDVVHNVRNFFEAALQLYPRSGPLILAYARFLESQASNSKAQQDVVALYERIERLDDLAFDIEFFCFAALRIRKRKSVAMALASDEEDARDIGVVAHLELQQNLSRARNFHFRALKQLHSFWQMLLADEVNLHLLQTCMHRIVNAQKSANAAFSALLQQYPKAPSILRAYGRFVKEVRSDAATAQNFLRLAEQYEQQQQAQMRTNSSNMGEEFSQLKVKTMMTLAVNTSGTIKAARNLGLLAYSEDELIDTNLGEIVPHTPVLENAMGLLNMVKVGSQEVMVMDRKDQALLMEVNTTHLQVAAASVDVRSFFQQQQLFSVKLSIHKEWQEPILFATMPVDNLDAADDDRDGDVPDSRSQTSGLGRSASASAFLFDAAPKSIVVGMTKNLRAILKLRIKDVYGCNLSDLLEDQDAMYDRSGALLNSSSSTSSSSSVTGNGTSGPESLSAVIQRMARDLSGSGSGSGGFNSVSRGEVVPLRLKTRAGYVSASALVKAMPLQNLAMIRLGKIERVVHHTNGGFASPSRSGAISPASHRSVRSAMRRRDSLASSSRLQFSTPYGHEGRGSAGQSRTSSPPRMRSPPRRSLDDGAVLMETLHEQESEHAMDREQERVVEQQSEPTERAGARRTDAPQNAQRGQRSNGRQRNQRNNDTTSSTNSNSNSNSNNNNSNSNTEQADATATTATATSNTNEDVSRGTLSPVGVSGSMSDASDGLSDGGAVSTGAGAGGPMVTADHQSAVVLQQAIKTITSRPANARRVAAGGGGGGGGGLARGARNNSEDSSRRVSDSSGSGDSSGHSSGSSGTMGVRRRIKNMRDKLSDESSDSMTSGSVKQLRRVVYVVLALLFVSLVSNYVAQESFLSQAENKLVAVSDVGRLPVIASEAGYQGQLLDLRLRKLRLTTLLNDYRTANATYGANSTQASTIVTRMRLWTPFGEETDVYVVEVSALLSNRDFDNNRKAIDELRELFNTVHKKTVVKNSVLNKAENLQLLAIDQNVDIKVEATGQEDRRAMSLRDMGFEFTAGLDFMSSLNLTVQDTLGVDTIEEYAPCYFVLKNAENNMIAASKKAIAVVESSARSAAAEVNVISGTTLSIAVVVVVCLMWLTFRPVVTHIAMENHFTLETFLDIPRRSIVTMVNRYRRLILALEEETRMVDDGDGDGGAMDEDELSVGEAAERASVAFSETSKSQKSQDNGERKSKGQGSSASGGGSERDGSSLHDSSAGSDTGSTGKKKRKKKKSGRSHHRRLVQGRGDVVTNSMHTRYVVAFVAFLAIAVTSFLVVSDSQTRMQGVRAMINKLGSTHDRASQVPLFVTKLVTSHTRDLYNVSHSQLLTTKLNLRARYAELLKLSDEAGRSAAMEAFFFETNLCTVFQCDHEDETKLGASGLHNLMRQFMDLTEDILEIDRSVRVSFQTRGVTTILRVYDGLVWPALRRLDLMLRTEAQALEVEGRNVGLALMFCGILVLILDLVLIFTPMMTVLNSQAKHVEHMFLMIPLETLIQLPHVLKLLGIDVIGLQGALPNAATAKGKGDGEGGKGTGDVTQDAVDAWVNEQLEVGEGSSGESSESSVKDVGVMEVAAAATATMGGGNPDTAVLASTEARALVEAVKAAEEVVGEVEGSGEEAAEAEEARQQEVMAVGMQLLRDELNLDERTTIGNTSRGKEVEKVEMATLGQGRATKQQQQQSLEPEHAIDVASVDGSSVGSDESSDSESVTWNKRLGELVSDFHGLLSDHPKRLALIMLVINMAWWTAMVFVTPVERVMAVQSVDSITKAITLVGGSFVSSLSALGVIPATMPEVLLLGSTRLGVVRDINLLAHAIVLPASVLYGYLIGFKVDSDVVVASLLPGLVGAAIGTMLPANELLVVVVASAVVGFLLGQVVALYLLDVDLSQETSRIDTRTRVEIAVLALVGGVATSALGTGMGAFLYLYMTLYLQMKQGIAVNTALCAFAANSLVALAFRLLSPVPLSSDLVDVAVFSAPLTVLAGNLGIFLGEMVSDQIIHGVVLLSSLVFFVVSVAVVASQDYSVFVTIMLLINTGVLSYLLAVGGNIRSSTILLIETKEGKDFMMRVQRERRRLKKKAKKERIQKRLQRQERRDRLLRKAEQARLEHEQQQAKNGASSGGKRVRIDGAAADDHQSNSSGGNGARPRRARVGGFTTGNAD